MNKIGIVLVNYHNERDTRECLDSLAKTKTDNLKVYLVQPDQKEALFANHVIQPTVISRPENRGFSWANNLGIKAALRDGCKLLGLLNNDTIVKSDFLLLLEDTLRDRKIGLVSPKIYFYPGREYHQTDYNKADQGKVIWYAGGVIDWGNCYASHLQVDEVDHGQAEKMIETDFATGCMVAFRDDLIKTVGFLDEKYFLYLEDVDWSIRTKQSGLKVVMQPNSVIWHKNAGSTGGSGSSLQRYHQIKSRLRFTLRYAPLRTKFAVGREAWRWSQKGKKIEKQAVRDFFLGRKG